MLVKIKKLVIENEGYERKIFFDNIYVNSSSIISISDYVGAQSFLLRENSEFAKEKFSLVKINLGPQVEELIVFGSAEQIYSSFEEIPGKKLLND